jgi:hypothetical protein
MLWICTFAMPADMGVRWALYLFDSPDLSSAIAWCRTALPRNAARAELLTLTDDGRAISAAVPVAGVGAARLWRKFGLQRFRVTAFRDTVPTVMLVLAASLAEAAALAPSTAIVSHWEASLLEEERAS